MYIQVLSIQPNFMSRPHLQPSDNKFVVIGDHLLPLTNYLVNGQYAQVQPIASKFAERCI